MRTGKRAVVWFDGHESVTTIVASDKGENALRARIEAAPGCEVREVTKVMSAEAALARLAALPLTQAGSGTAVPAGDPL